MAFDVAMAHHEEPQIASHLLASIPHGTFLEVFSAERDPIWWNLVANRPAIVDGMLVLPEGPGLGWELDADYIEKYRVRPSSVTARPEPSDHRLGEGLDGRGVVVTGAAGGIGVGRRTCVRRRRGARRCGRSLRASGLGARRIAAG